MKGGTNMKRKVVITGMGAICCLGRGTKAVIEATLRGKSGARLIERFDTSELRCKKGCFVDEAEFEDTELSRGHHLLELVVEEAVKDSQFENNEEREAAVFVGSIYGCMESWEEMHDAMMGKRDEVGIGAYDAFPLWWLSTAVAKTLKTTRPVTTLSTACSSTDFALGTALYAIRDCKMDVAVVAGVELLSRFIVTGFDKLNALSLTSCRPFDKDRDGLVLGEGAGAIILESYEHAKKRGATIHAELAGFGCSFEAYDLAAPEPRGAKRSLALRNALADAEIADTEVDFIKAHGTGTPANDKVESLALKRVFGERGTQIPVSSFKSAFGHTCGACGVLEGVVSISCIRNNLIPPTVGFRETEPGMRMDMVGGQCRSHSVRTVAQMAAGFGGSNTCFILREH